MSSATFDFGFAATSLGWGVFQSVAYCAEGRARSPSGPRCRIKAPRTARRSVPTRRHFETHPLGWPCHQRADCPAYRSPATSRPANPPCTAPPFPRSTILSLGYTVSDLHLFSHRSQGHRYQAAIEAAADKASLFVLNGDIFDFQWSFLATEREILDAAVAWIEALVATRPSCVFVFLIGNHDAVPAYLRALDSLSRRYANLRWQEHIFALGSRRFLHGDSLHGGVTSASLAAYRDSCNRKIYGVARRRFYEGITRIGLAAVLHKLVSDRFACQRVLRYLRNAYPESLDSVTDVYFGHTHNFLINYPLEGIRFHNCGGPFIGMRFAIQEFEYETNSLS